MAKGKSIYFTNSELENPNDFYNHWDDKLSSEDEMFYACWQEKLVNLDEETRELEMRYIQNGYGLIEDIDIMLCPKGFTRKQIDIDVAYV